MATARPAASGSGLWSLLQRRRSVRAYADRPVDVASLRRVLRAGQGVTAEDGRRAAPSAHGLHPIALHVVARHVVGLDPAQYVFDPVSGGLAPVATPGGPGARLGPAMIDEQPWVDAAPVVVVVAADVRRALDEFREQPPDGRRGARYADLEAGAIGQNMHLSVVEEGLAAVPVAGFDDRALAVALDLPAPWIPVLLLCIGHGRSPVG
jgi:nitroreductase